MLQLHHRRRPSRSMGRSVGTQRTIAWDEVSIWTSKAWDEVSYNPAFFLHRTDPIAACSDTGAFRRRSYTSVGRRSVNAARRTNERTSEERRAAVRLHGLERTRATAAAAAASIKRGIKSVSAGVVVPSMGVLRGTRSRDSHRQVLRATSTTTSSSSSLRSSPRSVGRGRAAAASITRPLPSIRRARWPVTDRPLSPFARSPILHTVS